MWCLIGIGISIAQIRRTYDRFIFTMEFPILLRRYLYTESRPCFWNYQESKIFSLAMLVLATPLGVLLLNFHFLLQSVALLYFPNHFRWHPGLCLLLHQTERRRYLSKYSALSIFRVSFLRRNQKKTSRISPVIFCDFIVWLKVKLLFVHFVLNIVLYSTAIYRDSMVVGCITVYPKKYAQGFCFAVLCCGYTLTDFPISIRLTSLALWQSNDCPSASKATLMNMDKYSMWIHYERLHNHNKAKHNKTVCIFLGIYCK